MKKISKNKQEMLVDSWKDEFEKLYDAQEKKCKRKQKFDGSGGYWEWVKKFFMEGGVGKDGWFDVIGTLLRKVKDDDTWENLKESLIDLGKKMIGEISKDNSCRKIRVSKIQWLESGKPDLETWWNKLKAAADKDSGSGKELEKALDKVNKETGDALKGSSKNRFF